MVWVGDAVENEGDGSFELVSDDGSDVPTLLQLRCLRLIPLHAATATATAQRDYILDSLNGNMPDDDAEEPSQPSSTEVQQVVRELEANSPAAGCSDHTGPTRDNYQKRCHELERPEASGRRERPDAGAAGRRDRPEDAGRCDRRDDAGIDMTADLVLTEVIDLLMMADEINNLIQLGAIKHQIRSPW
eukprot:s847_g20.t1